MTRRYLVVRFLAAVAIAGLTLLSFDLREASAQYMDVYGFGSREIAMGGAMTAEAYGPSAVFYNPAALGKVKNLITFAGYTAVVAELELNRLGPTPAGLFSKNLEGDPFSRAKDVGLVHGIQLGLALPLGKYIVIGTAMHLPAKGLSGIKIANPDESFFLDYESRANTLDTKLAVAIVPFPWLSVGLGTAVLTNIGGEIQNTLPIAAGNPVPAPTGPIELSTEMDMNWDFAPLFGIHIQPLDFFQAGLSYRGELSADTRLDLFINTDLNQGQGITQFIPVTLISDPIFVPQQVTGGVSFKVGKMLTLSGDVSWVNWSSYQSPLANIFVGQLGSTTFAGTPFPPGSVRLDTTPVPPLNFRDIFVPRIGAELRPLEWLFVRAGYYFRASPVPVQAGLTNIADSDTHVFSGGVGVEYDDPMQIIKGKIFVDMHGQLMLLATEQNIKVASLATADPDNEGLPGYEEGGFLWSLGFTTGIRF